MHLVTAVEMSYFLTASELANVDANSVNWQAVVLVVQLTTGMVTAVQLASVGEYTRVFCLWACAVRVPPPRKRTFPSHSL